MNEFLEFAEMKQMDEMAVRMMNPLKLAFLGDAIYEAYIRTYLMTQHVMTPHEMSKMSRKFVKASAQAEAVHAIKPLLSESEWQMIKRGRNQNSASVPKNAVLADYRYATGFEALIGYLYLTNQKTRLYEVVHEVIKVLTKEEASKDES
ncbi:Mini-ribonuclease 3 [Fusibacter tunisiensis]|jgi:ribonuclease-3 family protein|uniref:Mini-ribonuclease 3 n=1 Tax=Fusibacter tunisiensis TaxID=1008308 RepID=A0ABS2MQT0_9FIRM|nr:ribonuclease III domain-containing protein [Fusibacter tunisiensis]MBM7561774.1 ribonuclease-3 family protein [Fusibacter tunisiensis]